MDAPGKGKGGCASRRLLMGGEWAIKARDARVLAARERSAVEV